MVPRHGGKVLCEHARRSASSWRTRWWSRLRKPGWFTRIPTTRSSST